MPEYFEKTATNPDGTPNPFYHAFDQVPMGQSCAPSWMFGRATNPPFETVAAGEVSSANCLPPAAECHGVRGFVVTVIWAPGTTAGSIEIQGADLLEDAAFASLQVITYPQQQYFSPSGSVVTFMRCKVRTPPAPVPEVAARLMIR